VKASRAGWLTFCGVLLLLGFAISQAEGADAPQVAFCNENGVCMIRETVLRALIETLAAVTAKLGKSCI
jgi:hypothetical protein